jgi:hypothetical protein
MNDIQTITIYFKIVYALVGVVIIAYSIYLANAGRQARASLVARASRDKLG